MAAGVLCDSLTADGKKLYLYTEVLALAVLAQGIMRRTASSPLTTASSRYRLALMSTIDVILLLDLLKTQSHVFSALMLLVECIDLCY